MKDAAMKKALSNPASDESLEKTTEVKNDDGDDTAGPSQGL